MSKKTVSGNEMRMTFLSEDLTYELLKKDIRVKKLLLKGGFGDWLLVITAKIAGRDCVAFVGGSSIASVARKVHEKFLKDEIAWKEDQYSN